MIVNNVNLLFLPNGAAAAEAVPAPNQHVYVDITAGTMTHLQTNAKGLIVGAPLAATAVGLDDARDYQILVSPTDLGTPPPATQGVAARVASGKLMVAPHIAVKVNGSGSGAVGGLVCSLTVGTTVTKVTSTKVGWIVSNDTGSGAVTLRCDTKVLSTAAGAAGSATLALEPAAPTRGDVTTIKVTPPAGAAGFKVTAWSYAISHQVPGAAAALTGTITRAASEDPTHFDQNWAGELCASGKLTLSFVTGVSLRASGAASVKATVTAADAASQTLDVSVKPRTGKAWESTLVEKAVADLTKAISAFEDTGRHEWASSGPDVKAAKAIATGPNRGCEYVASAVVTFTSSPFINSLLSNASSTFSQAQGKAYLVKPRPVQVIPRDLYTIGDKGVISIKSVADFRTRMGVGDQPVEVTAHCIEHASLLSGTRRHEFEDPAPGARSHKGNCLKAMRALDPVRFAEGLVKLPGKALDFTASFNGRVTTVVKVAPIHTIVDEAQSLSTQKLELVAGATIANVNANASNTMIGPVWNPATNATFA